MIDYLFISYAHDDGIHPFDFAWWLNYYGIWLWMDKELQGGTQWHKILLQKIEGSSGLIFLASPRSVKSKYCKEEWKYALKLGKPVYPVILEQCKMPRQLKKIQWIQLDRYQGLDKRPNISRTAPDYVRKQELYKKDIHRLTLDLKEILQKTSVYSWDLSIYKAKNVEHTEFVAKGNSNDAQFIEEYQRQSSTLSDYLSQFHNQSPDYEEYMFRYIDYLKL